MSKRIFGAVALAALTALPLMAQETPITTLSTPPDAAAITLTPLVEGLQRPLYVTAAPGSEALYILEQGGRIQRVEADGSNMTLYLDLSGIVSSITGYSERGLLGLAFHPDFAENGVFFVNYTDQRGNSVVARYTGDAMVADPESAQIILTQEQPFPNHNGGHIAFGPDGYLYIAFGDGGSANDPLKAGQDLQTLLGKILRIDVSAEEGYTIPADNPFINGGGLPEIWAYGLRNPWRFSFDRATGDLYMGDVGQNVWEEINFQPADSTGGENYGWSGYEASQEFHADQIADNVVMPIAEYDHGGGNGCSVTGGYVYRGEAIPSLQGAYLYSDYCTGRVWVAYRDEGDTWQSAVFLESGAQVSSFGEDASGELLLVDYGGTIYRFDSAS